MKFSGLILLASLVLAPLTVFADTPVGVTVEKGAKKKKPKKKKSGFSVGVRAEGRLKTEPSTEAKPSEIDVDIRPKLVGKLTTKDHALGLVYNPRFAIPAKGPRAGDFDHLHRIVADWKWKVSKMVTLSLKQGFEVGIRDFQTVLPPIDAGVDADPLGYEADEAELESVDDLGEEEAPVEDDDAPVEDETPLDEEDAPIDEDLPEDEPYDETGDEGDYDAGVEEELVEEDLVEDTEEQLLLIEKIFLLKTQTDLTLGIAPSKTQKYTTKASFLRSGALDEAAQKQFPERMSPAVKFNAAFKLSKSDSLTPSAEYAFNTFNPSEAESHVGRADLTYARKLFGKSKLRVGAGLGIVAFEDNKLKDLFLTPDALVALDFDVPAGPVRIQAGLTGSLAPYISSSSGKGAPKVSSLATVKLKTKVGVTVKTSGGVSTTTLTDSADFQGYTAQFDGSVGWAFTPWVGIDLGAVYQHIQKADRKGVTPEPTERWGFFLAVTVDSGLLP